MTSASLNRVACILPGERVVGDGVRDLNDVVAISTCLLCPHLHLLSDHLHQGS